MALLKLLIITFCCLVYTKSNNIPQDVVESRQFSPEVSSVLQYLNSNTNGVYKYESGSLLSAQKKADIVEVTVEVNVKCLKTYPDLPCQEQALICHAFIGKTPEESATYQVLSDVKCNPKIDIVIDDTDEGKSASVPLVFGEQSQGEMGKIDLSSEAFPASQGDADFVAVPRDNVPCLGCPFDLNLDAVGVDELINTAVKHIESERSQRHKIVNIRRLQQQVVAGLKYILLAEVAPTMCAKDADLSAPCILDKSVDPFVCEVTFIQKPWISRDKHIIKNNCTVSQEYEPVNVSKRDQDDINNEILPQGGFNDPIPEDNKLRSPLPNYDAIAQTGHMEEEMDPARLADLESQIIIDGIIESPKAAKVENPKNTEQSEVLRQENLFVDEPSSTISDINDLEVEPLQTEYKPLVRIPLYSSVPIIDELDPLIIMYNYQNEEHTKQSEENVVVKSEEAAEKDFQSFLSRRERLKRSLHGDSDSDSDSTSESKEKKGKKPEASTVPANNEVDLVKREAKDTSEQSDESNNTTEEKKDKKKSEGKVKREAKDTSEESNESKNTTEEKKDEKKSADQVRREAKNTSEQSDESNNTTEEKKDEQKRVGKVKREAKDTSEESNESNNTTEEKKDEKKSVGKVKRKAKDTSEQSDESNNTSEEKKGDKKDEEKEEKKNAVRRAIQDVSSDENSELSESETTAEKKKRVRRAKDDNKEDDSSSSSSSSEEDNNVDVKKEKLKKIIENNKDNDSSSSSSSDDDDNNNNDSEVKREKLRAKDQKDDDDSSSSSSSSEDDEKHGRHRRSIGQMEKITADEKVIVRDLADFAAATLDNIDDDNHKRVILQILGAKKLKLDGIYYQIILRLGISHCTENEHNENCREKLFTNLTKICKVQVHVDDDYSNPKVVKSQCQNIKKDENDRNRTNYSRYKRSFLVGGNTPMSTSDPTVDKVVNATLAHLDANSGQAKKHKAVEIISATSQVVAGIRYVVTAKIGVSECDLTDDKPAESCGLLSGSEPRTCEIEVWDRPWLNKTIYNVNCNDTIYKFGDIEEDKDSKRKKRGIPGAPNEIEKDHPRLQEHMNRILSDLDSRSEHEYKYMVDEVLSASRQVVAGLLYRIEARLALSECKKGSDKQTGCGKLANPPSEPIVCKFTVIEQAWLHFIQTNYSCDNGVEYSSRRKREIGGFRQPQLVGAEEDIPNNHPEATNYVHTALEYLSSRTVSPTKYQLKRIKRVSKRVVAGNLWSIDAEVDICTEINWVYDSFILCLYDFAYQCHFTVLHRPWLIDGLKMTIKCDEDDEEYTYEPVGEIKEVEGIKEVKGKGHVDLDTAFKQFTRKFNKEYEEEEYGYRLKVFRDNLNRIALLNKYERGTAQYGITQFADLTEKEFSEGHGYRPDLKNTKFVSLPKAKIPSIDLPSEFDWRTYGAVTKVKNQGLCGSCWAFSVTGNVEGQYAIQHGKLLEFSEQELVDCDKVDSGCNGGLMDNAYRVIERLGGLESESDYPYEGDDEKCSFNSAKVEVQLTGAVNISSDETDMAKWLVQNGPISIAINANAMQFYAGGVSHPWRWLCSPKSLDHGVLIVGYGVHQYKLFNKTLPYWVVKNSWGPSWGEQGYYRVYRGDGTCGVNQTPSSAIVA